MKKKILFVYDSMMTGGTSTALLSLINVIDRSKYDISLLLYTNTGALMGEIPDFVNVLPPAYKGGGILDSSKRKIIRTVFNGGVFRSLLALKKYKGTPKGNLRTILMHYGMRSQVSLSRRVSERFDYAIGFMEGWSNEYVVSSKINAEKRFLWVHPQYESCYLIPEIDRKTFKKADGVVLIAENCLGQFLKYFPEYEAKVKVVPNIMSPELLIQKSNSLEVDVKRAGINFCTVCRCDIQVKGLDRLLKAFYELKKQGLTKDVLWHLIGGGGEFEEYKRQIEELGMDDTIILYGNQMNPLAYIKHMDAFILASRYEGKPVSVTEAQILGLPCLITNYESAPSQVTHGFNGMIMDNSYESIYETIKTVIENPALLSEWRANALTRSFGNECDVEKFYDVLNMKPAHKKGAE